MTAQRAGETGRVERVAPRVWSVPSSSGGEAHVVSAHRVGDGWAWVCDCRGFEYRRKCSHIAQAVAAAQAAAPSLRPQTPRHPRKEVAL